MTICWREIIPVVKLAHSEPGVAVRVDASVCKSVCKCAWFITSTWCNHAALNVFVSFCICICVCIFTHFFIHFFLVLSLFLPKDSHQFLSVYVCVRVRACVR